MDFIRPLPGSANKTIRDLTTSKLRLFEAPGYTDDYIDYKQVAYKGVESGGGQWTVGVHTGNDEYLDLSSAYMVYNFKLVNKGGQKALFDQIFVIPDIGNGFWDRVSLKINNKEVPELTNMKNGYTEYIKGLLTYTYGNYLSKQIPRLFILDPINTYDISEPTFKDWVKYKYTIGSDHKYEIKAPATTPEGFTDDRAPDDHKLSFWLRHHQSTQYDTFQIVTPLPSHLYGINKLLPPSMKLDFTFHPQNHEFYLTTKDATCNLYSKSLQLMNMKLVAGLQYIQPVIRLRHEEKFRQRNALIEYQYFEIKECEFAKGTSSMSFKAFSEIVPKQIYMFMVKTDNYNGRLSHSPYIFENFDAEYIMLKVGNVYYPHTPISCDFNKKLATEMYLFTQQNMGLQGDSSCLIGYPEFINDYTLFAFDLTQDKCSNKHLHRNRQANTEIEVKLRKPLPDNCTMVVYGQYDRMLEIDNVRNAMISNF